MKDKRLETKGFAKEKAFEIVGNYQGKAWVYIANTKDITYETTKFMKEKAFEIVIVAKEPLTSHVHHVKIQNR